MKRFLAYICLFIFSFQVLPVKELGKLLLKGQTTEEVHESGDEAPVKEKKDDSFNALAPIDYAACETDLDQKVAVIIHATDYLPDYHVPDILTPPPNRC